ncbi:unnamed protein product [Moneuplotes crassus]|uniref:Protein YIPF n=1 Tax=Euplotes crassus TaxID=5936 RepID=A0AAD1XS10_EUPCR|nr:unnamed protein product [Moneuplotes crassus]
MDNSNANVGTNLQTDVPQENDPFGLGANLSAQKEEQEIENEDLDIDTFFKENLETVKLNQNNDLENATKPQPEAEAAPSTLSKVSRFMSVEYFKNAFNINTDDVLERIKYSLFPFRAGGLFKNREYDLYGPLWILLTAVFTTSIFGTAFFSTEKIAKEKATSISLHQIGKSFILSLIYLLICPLVVYYHYTKEGARSAQYLEIVSIYGYSFAILPVIEVLILIPLGWFRLCFLAAGAFISGFLIRRELFDLNKKYLPRKEITYIRNYGVIAHVIWLLLFKLLFL